MRLKVKLKYNVIKVKLKIKQIKSVIKNIKGFPVIVIQTEVTNIILESTNW